ncbi:hypothetical protein GWI33_014791 [Rhynchophorus ferrugineus]|uniref:Uncharacterized protein n=1 Tax=Rhynchophorus ferrugineus TaxID=354439 RepID=A0A834I3R3_RHYFE|nr:hypothetical protein GWI33_014791 [Rhynchophorus ferrugineus]
MISWRSGRAGTNCTRVLVRKEPESYRGRNESSRRGNRDKMPGVDRPGGGGGTGTEKLNKVDGMPGFLLRYGLAIRINYITRVV